jgi:hypothetical protein
VNEGVREPLLDGSLAPAEVELALRAAARDGAGVLDEPLGGIGASVEEDVLHSLEEVGVDVLVDGELPALTMPMSSPARIAW